MNTCEITNELIKKTTYDVMLLISAWGIANISATVALTDKNMKPDNASKYALAMQLFGIFTTAVGVYKYSQ